MAFIVVLDGKGFGLGEKVCLLELRTRTEQQIEGESLEGKDPCDPQQGDGSLFYRGLDWGNRESIGRQGI